MSVSRRLAQAVQLLRDGRPGEAIGPLREAAAWQPDNPTIQHDFGLACLEVGQLPEAVAAFQRAVAEQSALRRRAVPPRHRPGTARRRTRRDRRL